jgi:hypothetical protein
MPDFPHLELPVKIRGQHNAHGGGKPNPKTQANIQNRQVHGSQLSNLSGKKIAEWEEERKNRPEDLPDLPESISLFLEVDPGSFSIETLESIYGIELISEENDGFIIGASTDVSLTKLREKIDQFINQSSPKYKNSAAKLWNIVEGQQWKVEQILSDELREKWDLIEDNTEYYFDISVACYVRISDYPEKKEGVSDEKYLESLERWNKKRESAQIKQSELEMERQTLLENFIESYGEVTSGYIGYDDSFTCRIKITGAGIKDLIFNFPYLFEVTEYDGLQEPATEPHEYDFEYDPELIAPSEDAPRVCIIDSGIQEGHKLLEKAIETGKSRSYVPDDGSVADKVRNGGHGTKVAGAILYGSVIPKSGKFKLETWLQNARILDSNKSLDKFLFPPDLMNKVFTDFYENGGTKIFNLSVNSRYPCRTKHMSAWAAQIDKLSYDNDILFIVSAGNLARSTPWRSNPGILEHLNSGAEYPDYLCNNSCRIANPSQALNALTVGSIGISKYEDEDLISFSDTGDISSFSRTGLGIWGSIKPELVEYGGDLVREKSSINVIPNDGISVDLVSSTLDGTPAVSKDIGTSFSAPKVAHILSSIQKTFPGETTLLYRGLAVHSARWPQKTFETDNHLTSLRHYGYGIPSKERAIRNNLARITFIQTDTIKPKQANVYSIKIPEALRRPGDNYQILIEITLSYKAEPRRTRKGTKSYLSTWLDWETSKEGEKFGPFKSRMLKNVDSEDDLGSDNSGRGIDWTIRKKIDKGIPGVRLSESTLQKDWAIVPSYSLPEEMGLAIVGHKGWERNLEIEVPYSVIVSFEAVNQDIDIYEIVRIENEIDIEVRV